MRPTIVGRSSSHYTRLVRMFALEAQIEFEFQPILDLMSLQKADYAGNPALKLPILVTSDGPLYGSLNICQALDGLSPAAPALRWPWQMPDRVAANAAELVQQAMATEVQIVLNRLAGVADDSPQQRKALTGMAQTLDWLDRHAEQFLQPDQRPGYLELALYCLLTHIPFREVMVLEPLPNLEPWREGMDRRDSARATVYRFD